jgi:hypothetical protein
MSKVRNRLLITLILAAAISVASVSTASAASGPWTISAWDPQPQQGIGGTSGEPDVGQTSPASVKPASYTDSTSSSRVGLNDWVRLAVQVWRARYFSTGF